MGMSASQARLLSITARLTSNELSSQLITNSKIRLATKSEQASDDYMAALNKTKLNFQYFNNNGEAETYDLTPSVLYTYAPLKSQYAIQDVNGKNLVSALDAKNYEETDSLHEFLSRYDLTESFKKSTTVTETNPDWTKWLAEHEVWVNSEPDPGDYTKTITETTTKTVTTRENTSPIYPMLTTTLATCFNNATDEKGCYMHVLSALIGVGTHTTSDGNTFNVSYTTDTCDEHGKTWCWNTYSTDEEIGDDLRQTLKTDTLSTDAYDGQLQTDYGEVYCKGSGADTAQYGNNVYQKIVDFLWEVHDQYSVGSPIGGSANKDSLARFFYLIEFDLGESTTVTKEVTGTETKEVLDPDAYNVAYGEWLDAEPVEPPQTIEVTKEVETVAINDKEKGQWYVNLWYMMNGSETANLVESSDDFVADYPLFEVLGAPKSSLAKQNYEVLEEGVTNDSTWLQYALDNGIVQLVKTQYTDPGLDSGKVAELNADAITWKSVTYQNTQDIYSVEDERAITIAQAKYEKAVKEIEAKENKYDTQLKNLDTIHNALQTEYESVKNVIAKNVERSFKAFS